MRWRFALPTGEVFSPAERSHKIDFRLRLAVTHFFRDSRSRLMDLLKYPRQAALSVQTGRLLSHLMA